MKIAKKCVYCGKKFMAKTMKTRYCSLPCNQKHWKIKNKKKQLESELLPPIQNPQVIPYDQQLRTLKEKEHISVKDVMTLLGLSRSTIYRLIKKGYLKSSKIGSRIVIRRKDLNELIDDQIDNDKKHPIKLNTVDKTYQKGYFYMSEIPEYYNISKSSIERAIKEKGIQKIKDGRFTFIKKEDIIKIFGKPIKTPSKNG